MWIWVGWGGVGRGLARVILAYSTLPWIPFELLAYLLLSFHYMEINDFHGNGSESQAGKEGSPGVFHMSVCFAFNRNGVRLRRFSEKMPRNVVTS